MAVKIEKDTIIGDILDIAPQAAPLPGESLLRKHAWFTASSVSPSWLS